MNTFALGFAIAAPLALALGWAAPAGRPAVVRLAPWAALPAWVLALVGPTGPGVELDWIVLGTRLGLDAAGRVFLFFTALLWGRVARLAARPWRMTPRASGFSFFTCWRCPAISG